MKNEITKNQTELRINIKDNNDIDLILNDIEWYNNKPANYSIDITFWFDSDNDTMSITLYEVETGKTHDIESIFSDIYHCLEFLNDNEIINDETFNYYRKIIEKD